MKIRKKLISFVTTFILIFSLTNLNVMASSVTSDTAETSYSVSYKIYDVNGNLRETGTLPISEEAAAAEPAQSSMDYPARTLINGEVMTLDTKEDTSFVVNPGASMTMSFGLSHNSSMFAGIYNITNSTYLKEWTGWTGGLSIGATANTNMIIIGRIQNRSFEPVTVTWASFNCIYPK